MARRTDEHLSAICLPLDPDGWRDDLAANVGGDDSSYTETGPRPGRSVPDQDTSVLRPVLSGAQSADIDLVVLAGGHASLDTHGAVQVGYRFRGEANTLVRGWSPPNWVTGWSSPVWTTTDTFNAVACTLPQSQAVAVAYRDTTGGSRYVTTYDPSTATWSTAVEVYSGSGADFIVAIGTRLVLTTGNRAYRSDDGGTTWEKHSLGVWPSTHDPSDYDYSRGAVGADGTVLAIVAETSTGTLVQVASSDGMSTLSVVHEMGGEGLYATACALPVGGFLLGYVRTSGPSDEIVIKRLGHAYEPFETATEVIPVAGGAVDLALTCDPDGVIWLHYGEFPADGKVKVMTSTDGGVSWTALDEGAIRGLSTSDAAVTGYVGVGCEGSVILIGHPDASTNTSINGSIVAVHLGGWSNLPASTPDWTDARDWTSRSGHGPSGGSNAVWTPGELPGDSGWTSSGAASQTFLSDGRLRILTSGGDARSYSRTGIASQSPATVMAGLVCPSGGALTGNDIAIDRWVSWAGHEYRMVVRCSYTDGIRVRDASAGTTLATLSTWDCSEPFQVCMLISTTSVDSGCWVRRPYQTTWTTVWSGALADNTTTPTGSGGLEWGNVAASTGVMSVWYYVADSTSGAVGQGLGSTPAVGRPLTSLPVPLPAETGRAWLAATSGPGALGETFACPVSHDYAIENLFPSVSPSPRAEWRSQDAAETFLAWDHGRARTYGDSIALPAIRAGFRTADLMYYDGTDWVGVGTMDLVAEGYESIAGTLTGNTLSPAGSSTGRFIAEGELAGGYAILGDPLDLEAVCRRIQWNTAGRWQTTGPQVRVILEGVDGSEVADEVTLVWPSGVLVVHPPDHLIRRRWRIRIGPQPVPDGRFSAGILAPMALRILGRAPDWGWSRELELNSATTTSRSGTTRTQSRGAPIRTWSMGWEGGVDLFDLRNDTDMWIGPDDDNNGVMWQDVPWLLEGLVTLSESGAVPCVALAMVPDDGETLTDPSLWLYGRMTSSIRQDHAAGTEGSSEIVRIGQVVIREVV